MSADLPAAIRKGLSDLCDEAGAPAEGTTAPFATPARRALRSRRLLPVVAGIAVVLVVASMALLPRLLRLTAGPARPAGPAGVPAVPREFGGSSLLVAPVEDSPPGRVAVLIGYAEVPGIGDFGGGQGLAVSADGKRYRTVTRSLTFDGHSLLSPDGTRAIVGGDHTLRLVDLRTGSLRGYRPGPGATIDPMAFSPDGRHVIYQAARSDGGCPCRDVLIDLHTGSRTTLATGDLGYGAAFSPDGERTAIQVGSTIVLTDTAGRQLARRPAGTGQLDGGHAWSPDGRFLALTTGNGPSDPTTIRFLAVDPADTAPHDVRGATEVLGWAGPHRIVFGLTERPTEMEGIITQDLDTGDRHVLSRMPAKYGGLVDDIASDLLPHLATVDTADPDYGPWPAWLDRTLVAGVTVLALLVALLVVTVRRRRRRPGSPRTRRS